MRIDRFPAEFADCLSPRGRRFLDGLGIDAARNAGVLADPRRRFSSLAGLIDRQWLMAMRALLELRLAPHLSVMADPIPPETIWAQTQDYADQLPKTMRVRTAYLEQRGAAYDIAADIGLLDFLGSASLRRLAETVVGHDLRADSGAQVLRYGPGDYAGPHHDHHPENPAARLGYIDLHLNLCGPGLRRQLLVYAQRGHLTESVDVTRNGLVNIYRLPFWHYVTPLEARPAANEKDASRWVLLATYLYQNPDQPHRLRRSDN